MQFGKILALVRETIREVDSLDGLTGTFYLLDHELEASRVVIQAARDVQGRVETLIESRGEEGHRPARPPRRAAVTVDRVTRPTRSPRSRTGSPGPKALPSPPAAAASTGHPYAALDRLIHSGTPISEIMAQTNASRDFVSARIKGLYKTAPKACRCGRGPYPHRGACRSA